MKKINFILKIISLILMGMLLATGCKEKKKSAAFWPLALLGGNATSSIDATGAVAATPTTTSPTQASAIQPGSFISFGFASPDATVTIEGTNISVMVPANTLSLNSLKATFTHNGTSVSINSANQASGVTVNDFTNPIIYTLTNTDGTTKTYTVTVKKHYPITGTGITKCYDNDGSEITCGNSNYPNQDGDSKKPQPSFTSPTQNATYPNDYTTTDSIIGNVWKTYTEGLSGADCGTGTATSYANITDATNACFALNSSNAGAGYAGRKDWRLPNIEELISIMDFSKTDILIQGAKFPNIPISNNNGTTWSSTKSSVLYWNAKFKNVQEISSIYSSGGYVHCIAGNSTYNYVFQDNGDGILSDTSRGLVWQKCTIGQTGTNHCTGNATKLIWDEALKSCNSLNLAGKKWRLPNVKELMTLLNYTNFNQLVDQFTSSFLVSESFFTATTGKFNSNNDYAISITLGQDSNSGNESVWFFPNLMNKNEAYILQRPKNGSIKSNARCVSDL